MVIPMREELTRAGLKEARSGADVDAALAQPGTTMVVVNSICGCAAGKMRPGVRLAMQHGTTPDHSVTVFAGQDREAKASHQWSVVSGRWSAVGVSKTTLPLSVFMPGTRPRSTDTWPDH